MCVTRSSVRGAYLLVIQETASCQLARGDLVATLKFPSGQESLCGHPSWTISHPSRVPEGARVLIARYPAHLATRAACESSIDSHGVQIVPSLRCTGSTALSASCTTLLDCQSRLAHSDSQFWNVCAAIHASIRHSYCDHQGEE